MDVRGLGSTLFFLLIGTVACGPQKNDARTGAFGPDEETQSLKIHAYSLERRYFDPLQAETLVHSVKLDLNSHPHFEWNHCVDECSALEDAKPKVRVLRVNDTYRVQFLRGENYKYPQPNEVEFDFVLTEDKENKTATLEFNDPLYTDLNAPWIVKFRAYLPSGKQSEWFVHSFDESAPEFSVPEFSNSLLSNF